MQNKRFDAITEKIIGCAYTVGRVLGVGFAEKVYENALAHELRKAGLHVEQQTPIKVWYDSVIVGDYVADLIVEGVVLVELKAVQNIDPAHHAQCINYLTATQLPISLIINFTRSVQIKRIAGTALKEIGENRC